MDTLVMAVRSALLIVVTGAFMALWSGDVPDRIAVNARPARFRSEQYKQSPENGQRTYEAPNGGATSEIRLHAPLPENIVEGTYLVIDQFGRSEMRVVSRPFSANQVRSLDHYSVTRGESRWHFIRLEHADALHTALVPATKTFVK